MSLAASRRFTQLTTTDSSRYIHSMPLQPSNQHTSSYVPPAKVNVTLATIHKVHIFVKIRGNSDMRKNTCCTGAEYILGITVGDIFNYIIWLNFGFGIFRSYNCFIIIYKRLHING